ncbi:MAG: HAD-IIIC family phosphatase [Anaerolineae bacterium]|nr:HAD-IIIC family phosphatase [Anaerolineae bacterium]
MKDLTWQALRQQAEGLRTQPNPIYRDCLALDRQINKWRKQQATSQAPKAKIALVGSSTLDFLPPALRVMACALNIDATIWTGDYGQFRQNLLQPSPALDEFQPTVVIIATEWRALNLPDESSAPDAWLAQTVAEYRALWQAARQRWGALVIQHNFEQAPYQPYGYLSAALPTGRARLIQQLNLALWQAVQTEPSVAILDVAQISGLYGKAKWHDPVLWHAAKQTPAHDALPLLAKHQMSLIGAAMGQTRKCLVLDLDDTLWGGVIGEDGLAGIQLGGDAAGEAFVAFQHYVKSLKQRGIILAVNSKNNEADAKLPFQQHRDMVLTLDDIAVFVANWQTKDDNLRQIAATLNIGLDSLVFADNNPVERNWVRQQLPEVAVPELPEDPAGYIAALHDGLYFETLSLTNEDRLRADAYRDNARRRASLANVGDIEAYLASLEMQAELRPFDELDLSRITQLINKTNQFNLTTRRVTEAQVREWMHDPNVYTQTIRLRDKFGDNGLISVMVGTQSAGQMHIHLWLMSCRVLGRRVEETAIVVLQRHALDRACYVVVGEYLPTAKNGMVADLYDRMGFTLTETRADGSKRYTLDTLPMRELPTGLQIGDHTGTGLPMVR